MNSTLEKEIRKFGSEMQKTIAVEEMSELIKYEDYPCWKCKNLDDMGGCKLNDCINPIWLTEEQINRFKCFMYDKVATSYRRVGEYIESKGYTYSTEEVIEDYATKWNKGFYVSYTMRDVIEHCELELSILLNDRGTN